MPETVVEVPLAEYAFLISRDYQNALRRLQRGELPGRRTDRGRWVVLIGPAELARLRAARQPRARKAS
jgi:hypothetical protein